MNEEIKKNNNQNFELEEIFQNEKKKINEELNFYKSIIILDNTEEIIPRKIKKTKTRVFL